MEEHEAGHIMISPDLPAVPTAFLNDHNFTEKDMKDFVSAGRNLSQLINSTTTTTAATTLSSTMHVMEEELRMCENLADFSKSYDSMHGYMCLAICIFGAVANLLNIVVLTRKEMNESPINRILTGMAVADITLIIEYLPFLFHQELLPSEDVSQQYSWGWAAYMWFHANFSIVIHNVSIWLTLTVAVWRFIMIKYHTLVPIYCTMSRCHLVLLSAYVGPIFLTIPSYLTFTVDSQNVTISKTLTDESEVLQAKEAGYAINPTEIEGQWAMETEVLKYYMNFSNLGLKHEQLLFRLTIWIYSFIIKFVPSVVLTVFTGILIHALYKAEERSARLKNGNTSKNGGGNNTPPQATNATNATNPSPRGADNKPVAVQTNSNSLRVTANQNNGFIARTPTATSIRRRSTHRHHKSSRKRSTDRTTRLLIVILVLFLLTEFPQAILGMLSAIEIDFFHNCYMPLGNLLDAFALLNSSINFLIYYFMSRQFRKTFLQTFGLTWCKCPQKERENGLVANEHELKPLVKPPVPQVPPPQQQRLIPRPQIIIEASVNKSASGVDNNAASVYERQKNNEGADFVLKRTTDPIEQI